MQNAMLLNHTYIRLAGNPLHRSQVTTLQAEMPNPFQKPSLCLHYDSWHIDVDFDALVWQDASSIDIDLISDCDVVA